MEGNHVEVEEDVDSFIDDGSEDDEPSTSGRLGDGIDVEEPLNEEEIEDLIAELLEVESKAAEAQETLEKESLAKIESEVKEELAQNLCGDDLETAVANEMAAFVEEWEDALDELETESAHLQEQLDGAGIELPSLFKWIESQAPTTCTTEAWKKRIHWVGSQVTGDVSQSKAHAEQFLQTHRPVRRRHGKLLEEGASGFLQKKLAIDGSKDSVTENSEVDWVSVNNFFSEGSSETSALFGSKHWASVYLASTPQQAAEMGLNFPGVDEVEEIDDIDGDSTDPFVAAAVANEKELALSEVQKKKYKKVNEEEDANVDLKLQNHLKRMRYRNRCKQGFTRREYDLVDHQIENNLDKLSNQGDEENGVDEDRIKCHQNYVNGFKMPNDVDKGISLGNGTCLEHNGSAWPELVDKGSKRPFDTTEPDFENKRIRAAVIDSDGEFYAKESPFSALKVKDKSDLNENGGELHSDNTLPLEDPKNKFSCTACSKIVIKVYSHPLLKVIICSDCKSNMEEKLKAKDHDCTEGYCGWCGRSTELINCTSCKTLFCMICIKRNIGGECLPGSRISSWKCCCCCPGILEKLTAELEKAMGSRTVTVSTSESDSDDAEASTNGVVSSKRKRKKKIRRILDDAELGEETRRKIAIEKERQERLKSLQEQFSNTTKVMSSEGFIRTLSEDASTEVLGDASTGYIVNVVREKGEEAVRIPPSISVKLKVHQVAGIRFMWENIVQSVRKVKSGDKGLGCILAHTMGLGKTLQVIAFLYTAMRRVDLGLRTALIVMPVNVLHNWKEEFLKWKPSEVKPLRIYMLEDVLREKRGELLAKWRTKGGVFLIGYTAFRNLSLGKSVKDRNMAREICYALQEGPDILICDEAHIIKNTKADATQALKQVKCQRRIALTGSPLQNNLMEYYCMVDFVREGFLGSSHEFRNRFQNPIENGQHTNSTLDDVKIMNQRSHILYEQLKGFVQRMDMNVVKKDLPPKTVFVIAVKLSPLQRKLYKKFLDVHGFTKEKDKVAGEGIRKRSFFAGYQALAQIWNHPGILQLKKEDKDSVRREEVENFLADESSSDENMDFNVVFESKQKNPNLPLPGKNVDGFFQKNWWKDLLLGNSYKEPSYSGKMVLLLEILAMSSAVGDKALVFSQSIPTLDCIEYYLSKVSRKGKKGKFWKKGKDWYRLDGRTEGLERQKLVVSFNEPQNERVKCCLISTRAGSLGINLHAANRVIIVDGSWNPTYDLQAIYRAWRYGQRKPVFAYRLMAHGTMEEKIYKRQVTKESLAARVVDRQQVHRSISKEEMLHLFEFGDEENPDNLVDLAQENGHVTEQIHKAPVSYGNCSSDKLMESLLGNHCPSWIANYHEHETLLQENEEERLSKEEQDLAWEAFRRTFEWDGVRVPLNQTEPNQNQANPVQPTTREPEPSVTPRVRAAPRKCTNLAHMLTLRSQGTKVGCCTVCGQCGQEISWEILNRDGKSAK